MNWRVNVARSVVVAVVHGAAGARDVAGAYDVAGARGSDEVHGAAADRDGRVDRSYSLGRALGASARHAAFQTVPGRLDPVA